MSSIRVSANPSFAVILCRRVWALQYKRKECSASYFISLWLILCGCINSLNLFLCLLNDALIRYITVHGYILIFKAPQRIFCYILSMTQSNDLKVIISESECITHYYSLISNKGKIHRVSWIYLIFHDFFSLITELVSNTVNL